MREVDRFFADGGDDALLFNYDLDSDSIVFDIGGHEGALTAGMYKKFGCNVCVYEPIAEFYRNLSLRFLGVEKIKVFNYGVGCKDEQIRFNMWGESTSAFDRSDKHQGPIEIAEVKSFATVFRESNLNMIDVCSINIEGGEYGLLSHIIDENLSPQIRNFQIQFHDFIPNAPKKRKEIQNMLSATHKMTFSYDFVWENWTLK
tara:strand:- start:3526 stop:4131 length:606 start_codon:yes stop_codon:yes gene_type:complete